ncbi:MAG TPA: diacylglycerol kinase family protein [Gammaproteobacteria bacterium]|nr:diacylglycerol kinase family protein [Gammaproteobacteria bacterium]
MSTPLIVNPAAGRGGARRLEAAIREQLVSLGIEVEVIRSDAPGDVARCVGAALGTRPERILIAGGDGTVHEAVNGWMRAGGGAPLGVIPVGTGNDFMKMLNRHADDWRAACELIARGHVRRIDVARCTGTRGESGAGSGQTTEFFFANSIGIGFDAQVAMAANQMQWLHSKIVYGVALLKTLLLNHRTPHVRVTHDDARFETGITLMAIHNGRVEGGSFVLAPHAEIDDGLLDVVLAAGMSRLAVLRLVPRVLAGTHLGHRAVTAFRTTRVLIESKTCLPVHADGEIRYTDATCLEIEILPGRLLVIA